MHKFKKIITLVFVVTFTNSAFGKVEKKSKENLIATCYKQNVSIYDFDGEQHPYLGSALGHAGMFEKSEIYKHDSKKFLGIKTKVKNGWGMFVVYKNNSWYMLDGTDHHMNILYNNVSCNANKPIEVIAIRSVKGKSTMTYSLNLDNKNNGTLILIVGAWEIPSSQTVVVAKCIASKES